MAAFRDARRNLEVEVGHSLEDDEIVRLLAHSALDGARDPGRAAYQVAMTVCTECRRGTRDGAGRVFAVEAHHVGAATCDAQQVVIEVDQPRATVEAHLGEGRDLGPRKTHAGRTTTTSVPAATQTIPPRIRRLVWRRDHGRCQVPGCRSARYLEIHHVIPRSEGGDHDPSFLTLLCSGHHLRAHAGRLRISGVAPDRLVFTHGDGTDYGVLGRTVASRADGRGPHGMEADAVGALRRTGVSLGDARRAMADAASSRPASIEELVERAFRILGQTVYASRVSERQARWSQAAPPVSWGQHARHS